MTIQKYAGDKVTGLSTDAKPTNIADGAVFYETDTKKIYLKISGIWEEAIYSTKQDALTAGTDYELPLTFSTGLTRTANAITCDITQYEDSDAVTAIKADVDWNATDWDSAYGWGDHSLAGYLTTESDPVFTSWDKSTGISISESQISDLGSYLTDANSDGKTYGRKNATWVEVTGGGGGITNLTVVNKVDTYSVLTSDLGSVITITSSSAKTINLPSVSASDIGFYFTIVKLGTGNVIIQAADSDTILDSSVGGTISNISTDDIYSSITLLLISETKWIVKEATNGYWTTA